ncbi:MAG: metal-dependent transcriptional regulator [Methanosarcinaceae archaeon]|nr:metal-dependent transcriptional regulator [Methanosarcinaceae archaeon]
MYTDRIEEYLETIQYLTSKNQAPAKNKDLAEELGLAPASVTEMLQKLSEEGLITYTPYRGVELTEMGVLQSNKIQRKHRILEKFFVEVLNMDREVASKEACILEHHISELILESICTFMNDSGMCKQPPSNSPIECPTSMEEYIPISDMDEGDEGTVVMVTLPHTVKGRLVSLGMTAGVQITVKRKQKQGSISILIRGTELALGNEIASKIFVSPGVSADHRQRSRGSHS